MELEFSKEKLKELEEINNKIFRRVCNNVIFIYTPPKVGSTSLLSTLRVHLIETYDILHIHDEVMLQFFTGPSTVTINELIFYNACYLKKNVYVMNVYRTEFERCMSEYFDKLTFHFTIAPENIHKLPMELLKSRFKRILPNLLMKHDYYLSKYGIPKSMQCEFDHDKKYIHQRLLCSVKVNGNNVENNGEPSDVVYSTNVNYVSLRLMDSGIWGEILGKIFNRNMHVMKDNDTSVKKIGELYNLFRAQYVDYCVLDEMEQRFYGTLDDTLKNVKYLHENAMNMEKVMNEGFSECECGVYVCLLSENELEVRLCVNDCSDVGCICVECMSKRVKMVDESRMSKCVKIVHESPMSKCVKIVHESSPSSSSPSSSSSSSPSTILLSKIKPGQTIKMNTHNSLKIIKQPHMKMKII
jgi:hypothetical protein